MIKGLILGVLLGVLLVAGCVYFYFSSGRAPVATSAPPIPFERALVRTGLHPGEPKGAIQMGMYPAPPQLFHGTGVTDDDAWESYWKVENGIRMSGMPGFKGQLTETQIWQVAVLVKNADKITEPVKKELAAGASTPMEMAMPEHPPAKPKKK